ncbi:MAG: LON peptidase substrate-binding domain-containing protein [Alphaproteobacteria bacterium]|nr:LON peptidase substrate-binding domain-containing protein [Alphaproteobacteria bacterium]
MKTGFDPDFDDLPKILPIFPLADLLLLPKGRVSLRIFEPRYIAMIDDALKSGHRMIAMVQPIESLAKDSPKENDDVDNDALQLDISESSIATSKITGHWKKRMQKLRATPPNPETYRPETYRIGCAGRIISLHETLQQQYHIEIKGLYRYRIAQELPSDTPYRQCEIDFTDYRDDSDIFEIDANHRKALVASVKNYFKMHKIEFELKLLDGLHDEVLVTSLAMVCPFSSAEKQGLLEAQTLKQRAEFLLDLLTINLNNNSETELQ